MIDDGTGGGNNLEANPTVLAVVAVSAERPAVLGVIETALESYQNGDGRADQQTSVVAVRIGEIEVADDVKAGDRVAVDYNFYKKFTA